MKIQITKLIILTLISCNISKNNKIQQDEKEKIQLLIRQVLSWSKSDQHIDLLPFIKSPKDSLCIGFDFVKHKFNLKKLRRTEFFSNEFIENYNQIILTLDKKIKNNEFEKWNVYDIQTFSFANDIDPWCSCQEVLSDAPNPWNIVQVKIINQNKKEIDAIWSWGNLKGNQEESWKTFTSSFKVVKENNKWKVSYLEGFDFFKSIKKD